MTELLALNEAIAVVKSHHTALTDGLISSEACGRETGRTWALLEYRFDDAPAFVPAVDQVPALLETIHDCVEHGLFEKKADDFAMILADKLEIEIEPALALLKTIKTVGVSSQIKATFKDRLLLRLMPHHITARRSPANDADREWMKDNGLVKGRDWHWYKARQSIRVAFRDAKKADEYSKRFGVASFETIAEWRAFASYWGYAHHVEMSDDGEKRHREDLDAWLAENGGLYDVIVDGNRDENGWRPFEILKVWGWHRHLHPAQQLYAFRDADKAFWFKMRFR